MAMKKAIMLTRAALCCALPMSLTGCETAIMSGGTLLAHDLFNQQPHNFTAQNYAVADYLIQQAETYIDRTSLIIAKPLIDMQTPKMTSTLAKLIPEQIGVRLSQLGYRANLKAVSTTPETIYLGAGEDGEEADFILTGHYFRAKSGLDIKTRIIDIKNDRIVASFDYTIDYDAEVRDLAAPKPVIVKLSESE